MTSRATWGFWGNPAAVQRLQQVLTGERHAHAILLVGPEGIGKQTLALAFSKAELCREAPTGEFCGACSTCRRIDRKVHPDVTIVSLEFQRALDTRKKTQNLTLSIDSVRQIIADASLRPMEGERRVVIVDDVDTMNEAAQEAMLKFVEEPPPAVTVILLSDDERSVLSTIESRCLRIDLGLVRYDELVAMLESAGTPADRTRDQAELAAGRPGWALREGSFEEQYDRETVQHEASNWIAGDDYRRLALAYQLGGHYLKDRDLVLDRVAMTAALWRSAVWYLSGVRQRGPGIGAQQPWEDLARSWTIEDALRSVRSCERCVDDLMQNVRPRLALEVMVLQWPATTR